MWSYTDWRQTVQAADSFLTWESLVIYMLISQLHKAEKLLPEKGVGDAILILTFVYFMISQNIKKEKL